eukprot:g5335.t1
MMSLPSLKHLCTKALSQRICQASSSEQEWLLTEITSLPEKARKELFIEIDLDLDHEICGVHINEEEYWKQRYLSLWEPCIIAKHGNSWKQAFFEKRLSYKLESFNSAADSISELKCFLAFSKKYIHTLDVQKLPSHIDLETVFECLGHGPSAMRLKYGPGTVGMDYERTLFGMKLSDSRSLARVLERTEVLTYLDISNNLIDDDKARSLCSGLLDNISLTSLNLSKNKISDRGARAIAKILELNNSLVECDLSDNFIFLDGARAISRALKSNKGLMKLNLRMNRMEDEGCKCIAEALAGHPQLTHLNIASNNATRCAAEALCHLLTVNSTLKHLDASSNKFSGIEDDIYEALQTNSGLTSFKILSCKTREDCHRAIEDFMTSREELKETKRLIDMCT